MTRRAPCFRSVDNVCAGIVAAWYVAGVMRPPNAARGLWWSAFLILLGGAALAYVASMQDPFDPTTRQHVRLIMAAAVLSSGICVIAATSRWWMRR